MATIKLTCESYVDCRPQLDISPCVYNMLIYAL